MLLQLDISSRNPLPTAITICVSVTLARRMVRGTSRADKKLNFRFFASLALHRYGAVSGNRSLTTNYARPKIIALCSQTLLVPEALIPPVFFVKWKHFITTLKTGCSQTRSTAWSVWRTCWPIQSTQTHNERGVFEMMYDYTSAGSVDIQKWNENYRPSKQAINV